MEFLEKINENKTKEKNSFLLHGKHKKIGSEGWFEFLEREREWLLSRFPSFRNVSSLQAKK